MILNALQKNWAIVGGGKEKRNLRIAPINFLVMGFISNFERLHKIKKETYAEISLGRQKSPSTMAQFFCNAFRIIYHTG